MTRKSIYQSLKVPFRAFHGYSSLFKAPRVLPKFANAVDAALDHVESHLHTVLLHQPLHTLLADADALNVQFAPDARPAIGSAIGRPLFLFCGLVPFLPIKGV